MYDPKFAKEQQSFSQQGIEMTKESETDKVTEGTGLVAHQGKHPPY